MKLDLKIDFSLIKNHKKEIFVVLIYFSIFCGLMWIFNSQKIEKEDREFDYNLAETQYRRVKSIDLTSGELKSEVKRIISEFDELDKKLPINLKNQDITQRLVEITNNTGNMFSLSDCKVSELNNKVDSVYNTYQVKINSINGTYYQMKEFLKYIEGYESKVVVTQLDLTRNIQNIKGSITLVFYGEVRNEEIL